MLEQVRGAMLVSLVDQGAIVLLVNLCISFCQLEILADRRAAGTGILKARIL